MNNVSYSSGKHPERKKPRIDSSQQRIHIKPPIQASEMPDELPPDSMFYNPDVAVIPHPFPSNKMPSAGSEGQKQVISQARLDNSIKQIAALIEAYTEEKKYVINQMFNQKGRNIDRLLHIIIPNLIKINPNYLNLITSMVENMGGSKDFFRFFREPELPRVFKKVKQIKNRYHNLTLNTEIRYAMTPTTKRDVHSVQIIGWFMGFPDQPQPKGEVYLNGKTVPEKPVSFGENGDYYMLATSESADTVVSTKPPNLLLSWFYIQSVHRRSVEEVLSELKAKQKVSFKYKGGNVPVKSTKCPSQCIFGLEKFIDRVQKTGDAYCLICNTKINLDDIMVVGRKEQEDDDSEDEIVEIPKSVVDKSIAENVSKMNDFSKGEWTEPVNKVQRPIVQIHANKQVIERPTVKISHLNTPVPVEVEEPPPPKTQLIPSKSQMVQQAKSSAGTELRLTPECIMADQLFASLSFKKNTPDWDKEINVDQYNIEEDEMFDSKLDSAEEFLEYISNLDF